MGGNAEVIKSLEAKMADLRTNIEILEGKFLNQENEKVNSIAQNSRQKNIGFEQAIYNNRLKREIQGVFENQIRDLNSMKQENNLLQPLSNIINWQI